MKKVLFVANITEHIDSFHLPYMHWFQQQGWEVHVISNGDAPRDYCDKFYFVKIARNPYRVISNLFALRRIRKIVNREQYDIISCHTPMGGVLGRLCATKARKKGTKVIYTAHGFHFYNGASIVNWLFYYNVEKILARITDCIVTINKEDFERAKADFQSETTAVEHIYGIGADLSKFSAPDEEMKMNLKKSYGYDGKFVMVYLAEFIPRKNHQYLIKSMQRIKEEVPNAVLALAGRGVLLNKMQDLVAKCGVEDCVDFLGFRTDVPDLLKACDIVVSASIEEGFGINLIEGMATGLPVVASIVRGHKEMVEENVNGYLFDTDSPDSFSDIIISLSADPKKMKQLSSGSLETVRKFSIDSSLKDMSDIFKRYM